jgi:hypothetical protein
MMKKLVVTVFAVSLAALGCGSDDGTPAKKDAGPDTGKDAITKNDVAPKLDQTIQPGPEVGRDTQPDQAVQVDQGSLDMGTMDVGSLDQGTIDVQAIDGAGADKPIMPADGGAMDGQPKPMDGGMTMDGGTTG